MTKYTGFYHGAGTSIDTFSFDFTGAGSDEIGSGFYFTNSPKDALTYTSARKDEHTPKPGGEDCPTVHEVIITAHKLLRSDELGTISLKQAQAMCEGAPLLEARLDDWGDVEYEGRTKVFGSMVRSYVHDSHHPTEMLRQLFCMANDLYGNTPAGVESFNRRVHRVFGYDGVIKEHRDADGRLISTHICAFFPEQIEIVSRTPADQFRSRMEAQPTAPSRPRAPRP